MYIVHYPGLFTHLYIFRIKCEMGDEWKGAALREIMLPLVSEIEMYQRALPTPIEFLALHGLNPSQPGMYNTSFRIFMLMMGVDFVSSDPKVRGDATRFNAAFSSVMLLLKIKTGLWDVYIGGISQATSQMIKILHDIHTLYPALPITQISEDEKSMFRRNSLHSHYLLIV